MTMALVAFLPVVEVVVAVSAAVAAVSVAAVAVSVAVVPQEDGNELATFMQPFNDTGYNRTSVFSSHYDGEN